MSACLDCGRTGSLLCPACLRIALALGHTPDERLTMLGAPPLDLDDTGVPDG